MHVRAPWTTGLCAWRDRAAALRAPKRTRFMASGVVHGESPTPTIRPFLLCIADQEVPKDGSDKAQHNRNDNTSQIARIVAR